MPLFLLAKIGKNSLSSLYYFPAKTVATVHAIQNHDDSFHYSHRCRPTGRDYSKVTDEITVSFH